ncbi:flagellar hook-associated protein FlgK [Pacificoceanicola onchidii]|uniref:flagellar hook-associated protein FlgK n=1 Tax=Pacificoceanicola onchidii TaxID=2562685 RepID=UPI0010A644E3|nr:flagellar hook-associated protein FlgK [Pacificoceanicola onchidii]
MSLSGTLMNAFSGLRATSRGAAIVSTNIANATTESYGRRSLALSSDSIGSIGGVRVDGVVRHTDAALISDRRVSDSSLGWANDLLSFANRLEEGVGETGTPGALTDLVTVFENTLLTGAANPASTQRLESIATAANDLAGKLNQLSNLVQEERVNADSAIAAQVRTLNETMASLEELNNDLVKAGTTGADISPMLDERARLLDSVSDIVPLRIVPRENNTIAVYTQGGAVLLDGKPFEIGFSESNTISPYMTLAAGDLSGLTLDGIPVSSRNGGQLAGGTLGAAFELRDDIAVQRQAQLDGIARDLIERFEPGGPDTTLAVGDPGLFTDEGLAFDPTEEVGIAQRIELNDLVAPGGGGTWRLRDGLGALTQGEVGDATLLTAITAALEEKVLPSSATLDPVSSSFMNQVANFASDVVGERVRAENRHIFALSQNTGLKEVELSKGVDTDFELQNLMEIEQLYAANAKVMQTVDELLARLMNI